MKQPTLFPLSRKPRRVMAKTIDFGFNESGQGGAQYQCKCGWTEWVFGDEVTNGSSVADRYPCPKCNKEKAK